MWQTQWLGLGVLAFGGMVFWAYLMPEKRVYLTAGVSTIAFFSMALAAPGVERLTESGQTVSASVSTTVQMIVGLLGVLSLVVIFLYRLGEYPPPEEQLES